LKKFSAGYCLFGASGFQGWPLSEDRFPQNPEPDIGVCTRGIVVTATGHSRVPGDDVVPGASAHDAERSRGWPCRICCQSARVIPKPVLNPFIYVPEHIGEFPGVGLLLSYRMRLIVRIVVMPPGCIGWPRNSVRSRACRIFPLG